MLYLFQLRCDKEVRLLPIAEQTAALLERALLATDSTSCQQSLFDALRRDPFFAVAVKQAAFQRNLSLSSLPAAVNWLSEATVSKLQPLLADSVAHVPGPAARRYADLASQLNLRLNLESSEDAYWQALVASEAALLASCPQDNFEKHSFGKHGSGKHGFGKQRLLPAFPPAAPHVAFSPSQPVSRKTDYLLESVPDIAWRLPALLNRLHQQQADRACFDRQLEEEKLLSLRGLAYGASHEINNPLANIAARAQALLRDETAEDRRKKLAAIHNQAMRAHEMIADLMLFAHPPKLELAWCDLLGVAQKVVAELEPQATQQRILLEENVTRDALFAMADETQLCVALRAVIINSMEAIGNDGKISVSAGVDETNGTVWLSVRDDGPGIPDEVRRHMFDPFYSGREAGRGHGFGLSKCWRILREHDGTVEVSTSASGGTKISLCLPLADSQRRVA